MAVTKTHPIKSTLKAAIDYICNPKKTDGKLLVSSYGCAAETADIEFAWTRRHAIDKGTNLGRHLIQAFQPGEVTPEQAHEIGMELAKEILGGKYEFVLTTHIDKDHIHNHLIFNAVSFVDHKHYHSNKRSYHYIRRTSDRLCKEHGLSVIIPGQDKGKSYIEHQATQNGTSYKAKLKAAIDRLLPACSDLEELLRRLQREGYEIKRGKYISARAPDQERFTRLKTLGVDYTEEALAARIAGRARPSHQPKQRNGKISLLIDIQNNIKAQQSAGFTHWAKLNNLKQAAKTMNFLTEHGISSYGELESKLNAVSARRDTAHAEIKRIESRSAELALVMKYAGTYRQLKPLYDRYRKSNDKEKFLRGHEGEIILFEAATRELKRLGAVPLPTTESMKTELANLNAEKERLLAEYKAARTEAQEYDTQAFELLSQLLDIEADNAVVDIHVGTVVKNIQAAMHIQFQRCRDPLRLRLRLPFDLVIQIFQQRHILRAGVCDIGAVHDPHSTVNDRLFHRLQTVPSACRQFAERQDKVRFQRQRVIILAVIEVDIHRVHILRAGRRDFDDLAFQTVHQRKIFRLRVADQDIVLCVQEHTHDGTLCGKALTAAGCA